MKYDVWCPDLGSGPEDAKIFEAHAEYAAAEAWADREDAQSADYWIVGGTDARVCVRQHGKEDVFEFVVSGRQERAYSAKPLPPNAKVSGAGTASAGLPGYAGDGNGDGNV